MKKRLFAMLICLAMLLSCLPATVFAATTVNSVDITVIPPVHQGAPDFNPVIFGSGCKLDTSVSGDGYQDGVRWKKISNGKNLSDSDSFTGGELYEFSACLVATSGYTFSTTQSSVTVNLDDASFTSIDSTHIRVNIQLNAVNQYINSVHVTGLDMPKAGNTPDYSVTLHEDTCQLTASGYDTCKNGVTWYDMTDSRYLPIGTKFQAGHTYCAEIHIKANPGYEFPYDAMGYVDGKTIESSGGGDIIALVVSFEHEHTGGTATCKDPAVCTICGETYGQTTENHIPDTSKWIARVEMYHFHKCSICGAHCDIEDHKWSPRVHSVGAEGHAYQCADCKGYDTLQSHKPGPAATATTPQTCTECGYIITPANNHTHNLTKVEGIPATCTQAGQIAYYTCDGCSALFEDENGTKEVSLMGLLIGPLGHKTSDDWKQDETHHWRICQQCNMVLEETKMTHEFEDEICTTCQYDPTQKPDEQKEDKEDSGKNKSDSKKEKAEDDEDEDEETGFGWLILVGIGVACFGVAIAVTMILMKRKNKGGQS